VLRPEDTCWSPSPLVLCSSQDFRPQRCLTVIFLPRNSAPLCHLRHQPVNFGVQCPSLRPSAVLFCPSTHAIDPESYFKLGMLSDIALTSKCQRVGGQPGSPAKSFYSSSELPIHQKRLALRHSLLVVGEKRTNIAPERDGNAVEGERI
jgi:hypothetical protein